MAKITSIKQQKDKNRVNVYVDGAFRFGIDLENFVKLNLRVEQELTEEEIEKITGKAEFQKVLNRAIDFAMRRPRSKKEIVDWLRRKKVEEGFYEGVLEKLKYFDFLDDEKFAKWWVEQRVNFRPKTKRILNQELRIKGIDKDVIDKVLEETEINEDEIALKELQKKAYKWKGLDKSVAKKKMYEFLARHGFGWDIVKESVDKYFSGE